MDLVSGLSELSKRFLQAEDYKGAQLSELYMALVPFAVISLCISKLCDFMSLLLSAEGNKVLGKMSHQNYKISGVFCVPCHSGIIIINCLQPRL